MKPLRYSTVTDQVVAVFREGMAGGRWRGTLPGRLTRELGVGEGWLVP